MNYVFFLNRAPFGANIREDVNCMLHIHRQFEIVLVLKNSLRMQIGLESYDIPEGHAVLIEAYQPHSFLSKEQNQCLIIEFSPDFYKPFRDHMNTHALKQCKVKISPQTLEYIRTVLPKKSLKHSDIDAYAMLAPLCLAIKNEGEWCESKNSFDDMFLQALDIISNEYSQPISREYVAKKLHIQPQTLSRIFKKRSKLSFVNYVQYIRVYNSLYLLKSNNSVTEAAYQSGFDSIRTFNRVFKSIVGMTPSEYISTGRNNFFDYS